MSTFVRHEPCPTCGSRDNLARYSDGGGHCFGCGYSERGGGGSVQQKPATPSVRSLPSDLGHYYNSKVVAWLNKYEISVEDCIRNNIEWSPSREQLIYKFYGSSEDLVLWQARNFREGTTHKSRFFTFGTPNDVIARYVGSEVSSTDGDSERLVGKTGVIVEDAISALKVSQAGAYDGIPCFSSNISRNKLARLARLYEKLIVWLDSDKYKEAVGLSTRAQMLGIDSTVIFTELDPKEYSLDHIREIIE